MGPRGLATACFVTAVVVVSYSFLPTPVIQAREEREEADRPATTWYSRVYRLQEGYSNVVSALAEDQQGYLWLGTEGGLVRFDGTQFLSWTDLRHPPLPGTDVRALEAAGDGSLWLGFYEKAGVARIVDQTVTYYTAEDGLFDGSVLSLCEASDSTVWAAGRGGLARFDGTRWHQLDVRQFVYAVFEDTRQAIWIATGAGIYRRSPGEAEFEKVATDVAGDLSEDVYGNVWSAGLTRPFRVVDQSSAGQPRSAMPGPRSSGWRIHHDRSGHMWIGTLGGGLWRGSAGQDGVLHQVQRLTAMGVDITGAVIQAIAEDSDGDVWVGTRDGLLRFFRPNITMVSRSHGLLGNTVRAVEADRDGRIWVATAEGLNQFSRTDVLESVNAYPLTDVGLRVLHSDSSGTLWVGTDSGYGVFRDGEYVPLVEDHARIGRVWSMTSSSDGSLWVCHRGEQSLSRWHAGRLVSFDEDPAIQGRVCTYLYSGHDGRVWVGFEDGGLVVRGPQGVWERIEAEVIPGGRISTMVEDHTGALWIGAGKGISRVVGAKAIVLTATNGLPDAEVTALVEDESGDIWFAAGGELIRLRPSELDRVADDPSYRVRFRLFDVSDGLLDPLTRYGTPTAAGKMDGTLWFQSVRGVAVVDPQTITADSHSIADARLDYALADGQLLGWGEAPIAIPPRTSRVEFVYTAPSLHSASKLRFEYRLLGVDDAWVDAGHNRRTFYSRLSPGVYSFLVRARNGGLVGLPAQVDLRVQPTVFQTRWFALICVILALLSIRFAWQLRLSMMRRQFRLVLEERARIGREIHDTLLQGMTGIALKLDGISRRKNLDLARVAGELKLLRHQISHYLRDARQSITALRPNEGSQDLVGALRTSGTKLTANEPTRFELTVKGTPRAMSSDVQREFVRVVEEAIRNAMRHGAAQHVEVEVDYETSGLRVLVRDDGVGFDPNGDHGDDEPHWGLVGMSERMSRIGGRLSIASRPGEGTVIEAATE